MKSTRYQLLEADYEAVRKDLKLRYQMIMELRKEVEELQREKEYWIKDHKKNQKAIEVLKEIAIYEDDFDSHSMAVKAKQVLREIL